jgi:hypothetical protein
MTEETWGMTELRGSRGGGRGVVSVGARWLDRRNGINTGAKQGARCRWHAKLTGLVDWLVGPGDGLINPSPKVMNNVYIYILKMIEMTGTNYPTHTT